MTGANEDGAAGLEAIHRAGGLTVAQRPDTAMAPLMIESALKRHAVDLVLSLDEIAALLRSLDDHAK
jgi:two-component system chemotaxis response regulator CheB